MARLEMSLQVAFLGEAMVTSFTLEWLFFKVYVSVKKQAVRGESFVTNFTFMLFRSYV